MISEKINPLGASSWFFCQLLLFHELYNSKNQSARLWDQSASLERHYQHNEPYIINGKHSWLTLRIELFTRNAVCASSPKTTRYVPRGWQFSRNERGSNVATNEGMKKRRLERRNEGTKVGTKERRNEGTKERRNEGTKERRNEGTKERRNEGTKERRNEGTKERRNEGKKERRNKRRQERSNEATKQRSSNELNNCSPTSKRVAQTRQLYRTIIIYGNSWIPFHTITALYL